MFRLTKRAAPGASGVASTLRGYYDTAAPGVGTPAAFCAEDENNVIAVLAHFTTLSYRLLTITALTASNASWAPANGTRAMYVELVGGGAQGGGCATSSATASVGSGGGGGAYSATFLLSVAATHAIVIGAAGSGGAAGATGAVGGDTTWDSTVVVAKGGSGGTVQAANTTFLSQAGGLGGAAASGTGDLKISGGAGDKGIRLSGTQGWSGDGGSAAFTGVIGGNGTVCVTGGTVGSAPAAGCFGAGGGGSATLTTQQAGGAGIGGWARIWQFG